MINKYFFIGDDECQICKINKRLRGKKICNSCLKSLQIYNYYGKYEDLEEVLVACYYNDFIKAVVARYKFQKETYLYNIFSDLMYDCLIQNIDPSLFTYIIPIPCSKKTLRERGFNCAGLLAEALAAKLNIPYLNPLIKDHTLEQNKIELRERTKNLKGKIRLNKKFSEDLRGKRVLLVDDIITTGSTLKEAEKVLNENSASAIKILLASPSYHTITNSEV